MSTETLVNRARTICEQNGARFTSIREKVFRLLANLNGGIGAYELLEQLKQTEPGAKPATVYRALDFLLEQRLIHRIGALNAFIGCPHPDHNHASHFLLCDNCEICRSLVLVAATAALLLSNWTASRPFNQCCKYLLNSLLQLLAITTIAI